MFVAIIEIFQALARVAESMQSVYNNRQVCGACCQTILSEYCMHNGRESLQQRHVHHQRQLCMVAWVMRNHPVQSL